MPARLCLAFADIEAEPRRQCLTGQSPVTRTIGESLPMRLISDAERYKLIGGPYTTPKCRVGQKLTCEYRDRDVRVAGLSDAPIPWPTSRKSGNRSLIVCYDLAQAVRVESVLAVAHHWGVGDVTVWSWRKALGVARDTEGTRRLHQRTQPERYDLEVLERARRKSLTPKARAKRSAAITGKPIHPTTRAAIAAAARRPKSESFKKKLSKRMRKEWRSGKRHGHPQGRPWTDKELKRLGKDTDAVIAAELGRTVGAVQKMRVNRGILCVSQPVEDRTRAAKAPPPATSRTK
jgi:hypothetical protein